MKMNRTHDDETGEISFSIPGFPIRAHVSDLGHTGVASVQLQDNGGVVESSFADMPDAEAAAKLALWKFYKGVSV